MKYRPKTPAPSTEVEAILFDEAMAISCLIDREPGPFGLPVSGDSHPGNRTVSRAWVNLRSADKGSAKIGEWVVRDAMEQTFRLTADIFEATYEPVDTEEPEPVPETQVAQTKRWRHQLDAILQEMKGVREAEFYGEMEVVRGREDEVKYNDLREARGASIRHLMESIMWCGKILSGLGTPNPYPQSYNPESPVVEKTADNLKL